MLVQPEIKEFTGDDFLRLAKVQEPLCLSAFVPNAGGEQASLAHSASALRQVLSLAQSQLRAHSPELQNTSDFLAPVKDLLMQNVWHGTQQTLALFRTASSFHAFSVPLRVPSRVILGGRFFLKPLIPCLAHPRRYYVLALSDNAARLFHCRETECVEIQSDDLPGSLEEALSSRDFSSSLQGHPSKASTRQVLTFHGHSANVEEIRQNRVLYCRQLDSAIHKITGKSEEPLVLACVAEHLSEFRQVNTNPKLLPEPIAGNPDRLSPDQLHAAAQELLNAAAEKEIARSASDYNEYQGSGHASASSEIVLEAALQGRIRMVFIAADVEIWGEFDSRNRCFKPAMNQEVPRTDELLNLIAVETVTHGGRVYPLASASMPSQSPVAAVFRY